MPMAFKSVVFPLPDSPVIHTSPLSGNVKFTPSRTVKSYFLVKFFISIIYDLPPCITLYFTCIFLTCDLISCNLLYKNFYFKIFDLLFNYALSNIKIKILCLNYTPTKKLNQYPSYKFFINYILVRKTIQFIRIFAK